MALTQEQLQQLMQLGSMDEQDADLQQQLAQAQALGAPTEEHHLTPAAAALGGLGNLFRGLSSHRKEGDIRRQRDDLQRKKSEARQLFAQQMGLGLPPQQSGGGGGVQEAQLMGYGAPQPMGPVAGTTPYGAGPYGYTPGGGGY
jgi:hypothetical protein